MLLIDLVFFHESSDCFKSSFDGHFGHGLPLLYQLLDFFVTRTWMQVVESETVSLSFEHDNEAAYV